jgi:murein DD-endopeptidase MepM/ murein hydrolase activator NlpD
MLSPMIRRIGSCLLAALLAACASSAPAPVERRGASAPIEHRGGSGGTNAPASVDRRETAASAAAAGTVVVRQGDTLYEIAEAQRVTVRGLIDANGLRFPFTLEAGQTLRLPSPYSYTVVRGDTLESVARRNSIQPRSLALLNGLREPYRLQPGQVLVLPGPAAGQAPEGGPAAPPWPRGTLPSGPAPAFGWPVAGRIVDGFGPKEAGRRNDGVNIAAGEGDPVLATADGLVVYAGDDLAGYGNLLLVQHAGGWVSAYAHLSRLLVQEEQNVAKGQQIADAGSTGAVDRAQLHFELRHDGSPVDPLSVLPRQPR